MTEAIDLPEVVSSRVVIGLDPTFDDNSSLRTNHSVTSEDIIEKINIGSTLLMEELNDDKLPDVTTINKNKNDITKNKNTYDIKKVSLNFDDYLNNKNNPKHQMKIICFNVNGLKKDINNRSYKSNF